MERSKSEPSAPPVEKNKDNQVRDFAKGTVNGVASDIEKWIRDYAEHAPIVKEPSGSHDQYTLTLYKYFLDATAGILSNCPTRKWQ